MIDKVRRTGKEFFTRTANGSHVGREDITRRFFFDSDVSERPSTFEFAVMLFTESACQHVGRIALSAVSEIKIAERNKLADRGLSNVHEDHGSRQHGRNKNAPRG